LKQINPGFSGTLCIYTSKIRIIELTNLSSLLPTAKRCNVKQKQKYDIDVSNVLLSIMKRDKIIISKECLTSTQKDIILKICEDDIKFINDLKIKFDL
jgi:hypothetical protein